MADLIITAASVVKGTGASVQQGTAGASVTAGQPVYLESASSTYKLSDANSATAAARAVDGIALHGSLTGQPLQILTGGPLTLGAVLTAGVAYYLSNNAGGICPVADLTAGSYPTILGFAGSASVLNVKLNAAGVSL